MIDPEKSETIGPVLLGLLRGKLGGALDFAEAPSRLFGGNQTYVHTFRLAGAEPPWDAPLVLRILRPHRSTEEVVFESALQNALAPLAPRVLLHDVDASVLGGGFQIMERAAGRALVMGDVGQDTQKLGILRPLLSGFREATFGPWPELLAETHARLHALATQPVVAAVEAVGMGKRLSLGRRIDRIEAPVEELGLKKMRPLVDWLREREPTLPDRRCLCHGDLFPNQVYAEGGSVTRVIDWADVSLAPGEYDVGNVCTGIETIPLPIPGASALQRRLVRRFRDAYALKHPLDPEAFRFGAVVRIGRALVSMALHRAGQGPAPVPYDGRGGERKLVAHLARLGIEARLGT